MNIRRPREERFVIECDTCSYVSRGWLMNGRISYDDDQFEQINTCSVLSKSQTSLMDECPNFRRSTKNMRPE